MIEGVDEGGEEGREGGQGRETERREKKRFITYVPVTLNEV